MAKLVKFTIPLPPISKKNHQQIVRRKDGRPCVIPSKEYKKYEVATAPFMPMVSTIDRTVNVKAIFYMPTHRIVDLVNLQEALLDVLVKHRILDDDNSRIVVSMDGSRVDYDKERPRTEVEITEV
jgi:Holliday junction resolvase RusA-like endonuclease